MDVRAAINANRPVILIGYSHGASDYSLIAGIVTIGWTAAPGAASYHLRALLNGLVVFNQNVGRTTRVEAANIPPGSYTVQVSSVNAAGQNPTPVSITFIVR